ncbi:HEAT repeat domain-containing protein [Candidatus Uhrbacteria bacterium]|nr:HEAT repeat domain-containing protein [Candidatus Uhrbacteria bacterium]
MGKIGQPDSRKDRPLARAIGAALERGEMPESLYGEIHSQDVSRMVADYIRRTDSYGAIYRLVDGLPGYGGYDWNACCILQHFDLNLILETIRQFSDRRPLYESIGLSSILGEYRRRDDFAISYLRSVIAEVKDSKSWWRAAHSLGMIGVDDPVSLLKRSLRQPERHGLQWCLDHLHDKRAIINLLLLCDDTNLEQVIYPKIREIFLKSEDVPTMVGVTWLIGRLRLIDDAVLRRFAELVRHDNYELVFYAYFGMKDCGDVRLRPLLEPALNDGDPLIRRMATSGLVNIGSLEALSALERALDRESDPETATEMTRAVYGLRHPSDNGRLLVRLGAHRNENGLLARPGDRKISDLSLLDAYCVAEDPDNLCFDLIRRKLGRKRITNPVDFSCGTGRVLCQILDGLEYSGSAFGLESDGGMADFTERRLHDERRFVRPVRIVGTTSGKPSLGPKKGSSNLVIRSFGLTDRFLGRSFPMDDLRKAYDLLSDDGLFVTVGWDESFGDDLSRLFYRHVPDGLPVRSFEEWRQTRLDATETPRNCGLTWLKRGLAVPVSFESSGEAITVMGRLFGRDAIRQAVDSDRLSWEVSMGITCNTKREIGKILRNFGG